MFSIDNKKVVKEFVKQGIDKMYLPWNYKQKAKFLVDGCDTSEKLAFIMTAVYFGMPL